MLRTITLVLALVLSGMVFAHEQPTHRNLTVAALNYLRVNDPIRYNLLQQYGSIYSTLADGAWNEDNYFAGSGCSWGSLFPSGTLCYMGRFYFHFMPKLDSLGQSATCRSLDWGITGSMCTATSFFADSSVDITNTHTWPAALANKDAATLAPTSDGWRHLGYVIHLLEDLTSPPHTRNSAHPCIGSVAFCDPFEPDNVLATVNLPKADYVGLSNLAGPDDLFQRVQQYTHDNYYSARTIGNGDPGPVPVDADPYYVYGDCLQASSDVGNCTQVNGHLLRKIAYKSIAYNESVANGTPDPTKLTIDSVIGHQQFAELAPVAVSAVVALIKLYAPMVTVSTDGTSGASITSSTGSIDCGSTCSALFANGSKVTLTATAPGYTAQWHGDCSGAGSTATLDNLNSDKACTATFSTGPAPEPVLTITKAGSGQGTVYFGYEDSCGDVCSVSLPTGSQISLEAIAADGSMFTGWSGPCLASSVIDGQRITVTVENDVTCTAMFAREGDSILTIVVSGPGGAGVTLFPPWSAPYGTPALTCDVPGSNGTKTCKTNLRQWLDPTLNAFDISVNWEPFEWGGDCATLPTYGIPTPNDFYFTFIVPNPLPNITCSATFSR
jgi:hypothetical protein